MFTAISTLTYTHLPAGYWLAIIAITCSIVALGAIINMIRFRQTRIVKKTIAIPQTSKRYHTGQRL